MLTVTASNATQVVISDNSDSTTFMLTGSGGAQKVTPTTTTTYTATATGGGGTATSQASVTVSAVSGPTVTIVANPSRLRRGSSTLTVTAANATQVVISNNVDGITIHCWNWRHAARFADGDYNLHGDCHRGRGHSDRSSDHYRDPELVSADRDDCGKSDVDYAGDFVHADSDRHQCNAGGDLGQYRQHHATRCWGVEERKLFHRLPPTNLHGDCYRCRRTATAPVTITVTPRPRRSRSLQVQSQSRKAVPPR